MLAAHEVTFAYPNGLQVVSGWSAEFAVGTMTALTGPSGSGKSTLLYLLGLMVRHQHGELRVDGEPVQHWSDTRRAALRAQRFGFVLQDAALDTSRTVLDNVIETALYRRERRRDAISRARLLMERFGVGLQESHKPGQISGGQAQRIALCRALLSDPPIVLADEPTGNLDPASRDTVIGALADHAEAGGCVVIATHDANVTCACHREIALDGVRA